MQAAAAVRRLPAALLEAGANRHTSKPVHVLYALCKTPADITLQYQAIITQQLLPAYVQKLAATKAQDISNVVYGIAVSGLGLDANTLQQLLAAFVGVRHTAAPQQLANTVWAVATMGQQVPAEQLRLVLDAFVGMRQQANPQELANTVWAVATMGQQVPAEQLRLVLDAFVGMRQQATPQNVANTVWACAKLGFFPEQLLAAPGLATLLRADTPQGLANAAWACGQLGHRDEQLMAALLAEAGERLAQQAGPGSSRDGRSLTAQQLCSLCWAVAVLDLQQHAQQVLHLAKACSSQWDSMVSEELQQLWQVHTWLKDFQLSTGQGLQGSLTEQQLQQCRVAWDADLQKKARQPPAQFQRSLFAAVQRLPIAWQQPPRMEQPSMSRDGVTPDGALLLDIAGRTAAGVLVAVEADGPTHFRQPDGGLNGPTQYRNRALAVRGYRLVSVPWFDWHDIQHNQAQQHEYLLQRFEEAGVR
jgi:hypothetical protein